MVALWTAWLLMACPCLAQTPDDASPRAPVHVGPLGVNPTLSVTNMGIDSNVFFSPDHPESDYTATVSPAADFFLRTGRAQLIGTSRVDAIFFKQFADQGTFSATNSGRVDFALNRFRPYVSGSFLHVNDRPDAVIDARVQRTEAAATIGTSFRLTPRVFLTASAQGTTVGFGLNGTAIAATLEEQLNRRVLLAGGGVQYRWSPLTTILVDVQQEQTRFTNAPERNATGLRITPALEFKPRALISGQVRMGYFRYHADASDIPPFRGLTAAVDVRSRLLGNMVVAEFDRDLFYAADSDAYYLQTRFGAEVTRQLNREWGVTGGLSELLLSYSTPPASPAPAAAPPVLSSAAPASSPLTGASGLTLTGSGLFLPAPQVIFVRPDRVIAATGGISLRVSPTVGFGFGGMYTHRSAVLPSGRYSDVRLMANVTYALQ